VPIFAKTAKAIFVIVVSMIIKKNVNK
jgi:hypothetical protein